MRLEWWEIEPSSCDAALLKAENCPTTAISDVVERLKPGANVALTGTFDTPASLASSTAALEDSGLEIRDCGCVLEPAEMSAILFARKPLDGTVAANVLKYGTGALNIDASRIGIAAGDEPSAGHRTATFGTQETISGGDGSGGWQAAEGRWPANLLIEHHSDCRRAGVNAEVTGGGAAGTSGFADGYERGDGYDGRVVTSEAWQCVNGCPVNTLDAQSGQSKSGRGVTVASPTALGQGSGWNAHNNRPVEFENYGDKGGASRFFHADQSSEQRHEYLIRLIIQPNGTLLDLSGEASTEYCKVVHPAT